MDSRPGVVLPAWGFSVTLISSHRKNRLCSEISHFETREMIGLLKSRCDCDTEPPGFLRQGLSYYTEYKNILTWKRLLNRWKAWSAFTKKFPVTLLRVRSWYPQKHNVVSHGNVFRYICINSALTGLFSNKGHGLLSLIGFSFRLNVSRIYLTSVSKNIFILPYCFIITQL